MAEGIESEVQNIGERKIERDRYREKTKGHEWIEMRREREREREGEREGERERKRWIRI